MSISSERRKKAAALAKIKNGVINARRRHHGKAGINMKNEAKASNEEKISWRNVSNINIVVRQRAARVAHRVKYDIGIIKRRHGAMKEK